MKCSIERASLSLWAVWMYHNLSNQPLRRNTQAGLSPSLFSNRHCCNRRQDTAVLRLNALGQTSHSSAMHSSGPRVLQPLCTSGSYLQNRKQQDLPHEDAVRTNGVSVAHLEHSSCSKMPIIVIVIICFTYYMG